jgi:plastocyanin
MPCERSQGRRSRESPLVREGCPDRNTGRWYGLAALLLVAATAAGATPPSGAVKGTVRGKGLKTAADMVVSLAAPGLRVTPPKTPVRIDQRGFRFVPHVTAIVTGTTIRFLNNDPEQHNVYSPEGRYNLGTWLPGDTRDHTFTKAGEYTQLCNVHPDMLAFIVVLDTPYFAVTDSSGAFSVAGVPPGSYRLIVWSEKLDGLERMITVEAGKTLSLDLEVLR